MRFIDGVEFDFADSPVDRLAGGERVVLVNKSNAFVLRYGAVATIAGEYSGRFSNSGERVEVVDAQGATLIEFTYGQSHPWPAVADGRGPSLELRDTDADPALAASWSASVAGPTPGFAPHHRAPLGFDVEVDGDDLVITFIAESGVPYQVQTSGDLKADWQLHQQLPPLPTTGLIEVRIPIDSESEGRFYRIVTE